MSSSSQLGEESLASLSSLYLATLNDRELQAYHIAVDHLGMSFTMERSNGYRQWKKDHDEHIRKIRETANTAK
jgi:mevalonate pyrophosphate decarboxylase